MMLSTHSEESLQSVVANLMLICNRKTRPSKRRYTNSEVFGTGVFLMILLRITADI